MNFNDYKKISVGFDCVVLTSDIHEQENAHKAPVRGLQTLLLKRNHEPFNGKWSIPGGLVEEDKELTPTINGKLLSKINLPEDCYKEQLYTYGDNIERDPRGRVISISYIALLGKESAAELKAGKYGDIGWFWVFLDNKGEIRIINTETKEELADLAFDHKTILRDALLRLRNKANYTNVAYHLMPEKFTMIELQNVFEEINGKPIYSFRRFVGGKVKETGEYAEQRAHRPAMLFTFNGNLKEGT